MSNSTNNRWLTIVTLLLLTANIVTLALLWVNKKPDREYRNAPPQPLPGGQVFEFITHELKLDSAQQEIYKKLREEHQGQVRPLQDSIGRSKDSFFDLLKQENVSDSLVANLSKKIGDLEQQRDVVTFRHFQKLRAICSKEQKIKFDSIIQQALRQMGRPRGPRPGPRQEQAGQDRRDDRPFPKPGMKPDGKRPPPLPDDEMRPAGGPPPHPQGWRPEDGPPPHPPGMRRGDRPPPDGRRPPPPGHRPPGDAPAKKDSL